MKLLGKPIDAMVVFRAGSGNPRPYKFKTEEYGEMVTIFVDQVLHSEKTYKLCGKHNCPDISISGFGNNHRRKVK